MKRPMQHTITVLVENRPGVLARVSGLFARRGFNIESLAVSITDDPTVSRMTIVVTGDDSTLDQINKQTWKLIDVIKVVDYSEIPIVERELALIKVSAGVEQRGPIMQIVDIFQGKIIDISDTSFTIEVTGGIDKVDAIENLLKPYGIMEIVRTGKIAMARGSHTAMAQITQRQDVKELIDPKSVERMLLFLAIAGPLVGLILGALLGAHEKRALPRIVAGVLLGGLLSLVYGMWRLYGVITGLLGLDSVANLGLQLMLFAVLGCVLGAVILRISVVLKRWGTN